MDPVIKLCFALIGALCLAIYSTVRLIKDNRRERPTVIQALTDTFVAAAPYALGAFSAAALREALF